MSSQSELRRELGVGSAVMLGLGSILGTGVFVSIGLVAGLAGAWTPLAVLAAALVATCNALSSAQLAAAHPQSGGTYEYGYRLLAPGFGLVAGWTFLCAKSASAAAAALGLSGYLLDALHVDFRGIDVGVAAAAVIAFTLLVAAGVRRSNLVNTAIVGVTILALLAFALLGATRISDGWSREPTPDWSSFLESTALMFVAYTGYGRVATLGEEVRDPEKTIPRAIIVTLVVSALLYLAIALTGVGAAGSAAMAAAASGRAAMLESVSRGFGYDLLPELIAIGAVTAMAGVLLNLLLGLSRVLLAMGRRGDMPSVVARIDARRASPVVAVGVVGALVLGLTLTGNLRLAWSFSAFTVLVYYAITNLAALRLPEGQRLFSRAWSFGGLVACVFLAFWVDLRVWLVGLAVIAVALAWQAMARRCDA